ncbi:MAG TPA: transglutaminase-like domain-containing protein [Candidatus Bathyarchaeia archaeon]|nr:transglutaminase-like domain-containing protein [Candidatus Bathyarchaeia archaeon]
MVSAHQNSIDKYREISENLAEPSLLVRLMALFERRYTISELLDWMHERLKFDKGDIKRHNDPGEILAYGRGRCGEFSILFTSLCLAHWYRARLILDISDHVWTEVWDEQQKRWIHIDPSEKRVDDPYMYERDWKKNLIEIYAFENGAIENITRNYKLAKD